MQINIDQLHTAVWIYDIDAYAIIWANPAALILWGSDSIQDLSSRNFKIGQSGAVTEIIEEYRAAFKDNKVIQENWTFTPKGHETEALCQLSGIKLDDGRLAMLVEATPSLPNTNIHFKSASIISLYSLNGNFLSGNTPFIKNFSHTETHLKNIFCDSRYVTKLLQLMADKTKFEEDILMKTNNGDRWFRVIANIVTHQTNNGHILLNQYDIHDSKMKEDNLRQQALTDPLTGLINRRGLIDTLYPLIKNRTSFALLYIDLDGFKMVNDSLGHLQGDDILIQVTDRLKNQMHNGDIACRFGGDEFIFIIPEGTIQSDISTSIRCQAMIESLSESYYSVHEIELSLSASIGVTQYPNDAEEFEQLVAYADAAMYHAKKAGKKQWTHYQIGMENAQKRLSIIAQKLCFALTEKELSLHYQPIINYSTGQVISFEALLRWNNKALGFISPEETIRVAEEVGLIYDIETWVLDQALEDLLIFKELFDSNVTMAVNLSGLHLIDPNLVETISFILNKYNLQTQDLIIELTESVLLTDVNHKDSPINSLTKQNIKVSIDDFGTGYSSLAYLHTIPASTVKIDKSFLENFEKNTSTLECIQHLVNSLGMENLIEGIETEAQAKLLSKIGYNLQQGYFHGQPKPISYYLTKHSDNH